MLLHYLLAVINIDMNQVYEKQNNMHAYANLTIKKLFVLIITLSKEEKKKEFQNKRKKRTASLFSREKWMFVRILPFIRFFFKDLKTWSNMIGLLWYVISNQLTFGKFRLVFSFLVFFLLFLALLLLYHRIEKAWQIKLGLRFHCLTNHVLIFLFRGCFFPSTHHSISQKSCGLILLCSSLDKIFLLWIAIPCEVEYETRLRIPGFKQHGVPSI